MQSQCHFARQSIRCSRMTVISQVENRLDSSQPRHNTKVGQKSRETEPVIIRKLPGSVPMVRKPENFDRVKAAFIRSP